MPLLVHPGKKGSSRSGRSQARPDEVRPEVEGLGERGAGGQFLQNRTWLEWRRESCPGGVLVAVEEVGLRTLGLVPSVTSRIRSRMAMRVARKGSWYLPTWWCRFVLLNNLDSDGSETEVEVERLDVGQCARAVPDLCETARRGLVAATRVPMHTQHAGRDLLRSQRHVQAEILGMQE